MEFLKRMIIAGYHISYNGNTFTALLNNTILESFPTFELCIDYITQKLNRCSYSVTAFHNIGFGPEFVYLPNIDAQSLEEGQTVAEKQATEYFEKHYKDHMWEEVRIRPAN